MASRHTDGPCAAIRKTRLAALALAVLLAAALAFAACGGDDSSSKSTTTTSNKNFEVTLPDGQASVSLDGKLPSGWPSEFPLPSGAKPAGSGSMGSSTTTRMVGVFSSSSPPKDVYDFYANNSSLHPTDKSSIGVGSNFVGRMRFSGTYTGSLTVVGRDNTTYLVVDIEMSTGNQTTTTT